jgi:hypothetical protein
MRTAWKSWRFEGGIMPVLSDAATVSHRLRISKYALVLCCSCLFATLFGAIAIAVSFRIVILAHAGSPLYWSIVAMMLTVWLVSLLNMYNLAIRAAFAGSEKAEAGVGNHRTRIAFTPAAVATQNAMQPIQVRVRH